MTPANRHTGNAVCLYVAQHSRRLPRPSTSTRPRPVAHVTRPVRRARGPRRVDPETAPVSLLRAIAHVAAGLLAVSVAVTGGDLEHTTGDVSTSWERDDLDALALGVTAASAKMQAVERRFEQSDADWAGSFYDSDSGAIVFLFTTNDPARETTIRAGRSPSIAISTSCQPSHRAPIRTSGGSTLGNCAERHLSLGSDEPTPER